MAIRLELPPTLLPHLRLRWQNTQGLLLRQSRTFKAYVRYTTSTLPREWWQIASTRLFTRFSMRSRIQRRTLLRQQSQLTEFETQFDALIDLLCWTAKEGVRPESHTQYAELRIWMCRNYRTVRTPLRSHWLEPDAPSSGDPFEAIFVPDTVEEVINAAFGLETMFQTRAALESYRADLDTRLTPKV